MTFEFKIAAHLTFSMANDWWWWRVLSRNINCIQTGPKYFLRAAPAHKLCRGWAGRGRGSRQWDSVRCEIPSPHTLSLQQRYQLAGYSNIHGFKAIFIYSSWKPCIIKMFLWWRPEVLTILYEHEHNNTFGGWIMLQSISLGNFTKFCPNLIVEVGFSHKECTET